MDIVISAIGIPLGYMMGWCYALLHNYGAAIVLFTLLTKVILFPVSIWVQKNSITIVRIMPELNQIKLNCFGDNDRIAEEQQALYKREHYHPLASIIPLMLQLLLLIGVIGAVNTLLRADTNTVLAFVPMELGGTALLMPLAAGLAALILSLADNHINPLQKEQGKWAKLGTSAFSVSISLILGGFVPIGVGIYWISSNLFTILQQLILNVVVKPAKYIDYEALEKSRQELAQLELLGGKRDRMLVLREKTDYRRFFSIANKHLAFYSEGNGFYKYFEGLVDYLLQHSNVVVHYVTGDPVDCVFQKDHPRFKPYYIGSKKLITLMMKMDADIVVMTMPDLQNYHIKRSYVRSDIEYIYIPHGMDSLNMTMRKGSVDHYDTIFCVGPHQKEEIERTEEVYDLPHKCLVEWGYSLLDKMRAEYRSTLEHSSQTPSILIAPSWQEGNIVDNCLEQLLDKLQGHGYQITVRPHPQYVRHQHERMKALKRRFEQADGIRIETDFSSNRTVFRADLLITDWSGIAYEFAYTTCKPVLFIDTPMKVMNPEYKKVGVTPINIFLREEIGKQIALDAVDGIAETVASLLMESEAYRVKIEDFVHQYVYHLGDSATVGGRYILDAVKRQSAKKLN